MDNQPNEQYGREQKTDVNAPKSNRNEQSDVNSTSDEMNTANRSSTSQDAAQPRSNPGSSRQDSKKNS